jgi:hypothetical protein
MRSPLALAIVSFLACHLTSIRNHNGASERLRSPIVRVPGLSVCACVLGTALLVPSTRAAFSPKWTGTTRKEASSHGSADDAGTGAESSSHDQLATSSLPHAGQQQQGQCGGSEDEQGECNVDWTVPLPPPFSDKLSIAPRYTTPQADSIPQNESKRKKRIHHARKKSKGMNKNTDT